MPNTTRRNPDANFSQPATTNRSTGAAQRPSKTQTLGFGKFQVPVQVPEQIPHRFKKRRPRQVRGKRAAARSRTALTIPFDFEKPIPKF